MDRCRRSRPLSRAPLAVCLAAAFTANGIASAGVTSCGDAGGTDTLRYAVVNAASGQTISLGASGCSQITLNAEIPVTVSSLTILGPSDGALTISTGHNGRVFNHTGTGGTLTISHVTVSDGLVSGSAQSDGGCIRSSGSVALISATVSGCSAQASGTDVGANGGGIFAVDSVTLTDSTLASNNAEATGSGFVVALGGGVFVQGASPAGFTSVRSTISGNSTAGLFLDGGGGIFTHGTTMIDSSTIDSNQARTGAGLYVQNAANPVTTIINSTVSGNHATGPGGNGSGAIAANGNTAIYNSTIAFNSAVSAPAGVEVTGSIILYSTIIADNMQPGAGVADFYAAAGGALNGSHNLIVSANRMPSGTIMSAPHLTPLAYHGGPTRTHALNPGSPAIDAGDNVYSFKPFYDQRGAGFDREVNGFADIGAYERQAVDDEVYYDGFE